MLRIEKLIFFKGYCDPITALLSTQIGAGVTVGTAISAAATIGSISAQRRSASAQRRARATQQRLADVRNLRERREGVRKARVARAQQVASGVQSGADLGSSAVQGAQSSVTSQIGANLSFLDQQAGLVAQTGVFNQQAADAQSTQSIFKAVGGIGSSFSSPGSNIAITSDKDGNPFSTGTIRK